MRPAQLADTINDYNLKQAGLRRHDLKSMGTLLLRNVLLSMSSPKVIVGLCFLMGSRNHPTL